ncbi:hypothetical protein [Bacillus haynesii]|uniref:hypothetical protein n=1 Tax=Bacillus haynesii TaxID=1925021 RepID=UPI002280A193|nr:hypothetical protein [Bacillus haynesii]MCY8291533.1 hypothetical protein [Bacillus haynesii]
MGRFVNFNQSGYIRALESAVSIAMEKVEREVFEDILRNFGALNFREIDAKYVSAMRSAIRTASAKTTHSITSQFRAGNEGKPNQSFRLVYYEYGTGAKMRPPNNYSPSDDPNWNTARPRKVGERAWSRPFGKWLDAGGNEHFSKTRGKPKPLSPLSRRGQPVEASRWFQRGFWSGTKNLDKYVLDAVKSVPISSYIDIANIYRRV